MCTFTIHSTIHCHLQSAWPSPSSCAGSLPTHVHTHLYTVLPTPTPPQLHIQQWPRCRLCTSAEFLNAQWWRMSPVHGNSSVKLHPTLCVHCCTNIDNKETKEVYTTQIEVSMSTVPIQQCPERCVVHSTWHTAAVMSTLLSLITASDKDNSYTICTLP